MIYRVDSRKPSTTKPPDEVRDKIKEILWEQEFEPANNRFPAQLKEDAYIQIFAEIKPEKDINLQPSAGDSVLALSLVLPKQARHPATVGIAVVIGIKTDTDPKRVGRMSCLFPCQASDPAAVAPPCSC